MMQSPHGAFVRILGPAPEFEDRVAQMTRLHGTNGGCPLRWKLSRLTFLRIDSLDDCGEDDGRGEGLPKDRTRIFRVRIRSSR